ncbi:mitochondrial carrier [Sistotremastrum niveocremeum HHB9708]|uniref:Mitochondrial carrier n=1 Tax=Sistotremastrum niveocremeum HHB9708 TaxID=1314777 RepID=A0A164TT37_9AGAM|nr:mitochondrial carrier [Sistotremastrum niveocremeum HHB9708]
MSQNGPTFFPYAAFDHAAAGLGAATVAVLCMHPLDLLKIKFQVATTRAKGNVGGQIINSLRDIYKESGVKGLYRGVGTNVVGNASSWSLYFLFYTALKRQMTGDDPNRQLSAGSYLLCSAQASAVSALMTNPIWVVKVRMFTTKAGAPDSYRSLSHGISSIYRNEGMLGLWKGTSLALFGVSNGALQFMTYEKMKQLGFKRKKAQFEKAGKTYTPMDDRLSNLTYTFISGASKVVALVATYPYQVVRSRIQNNATAHLYPNIRTCVTKTFRDEGMSGFYRGLGTNLVRVLPGTCVTLVVYENIAWILRTAAMRREQKRADGL